MVTVLETGSSTQTRRVPASRYASAFSTTRDCTSDGETTSIAKSGGIENPFVLSPVNWSVETNATSGFAVRSPT